MLASFVLGGLVAVMASAETKGSALAHWYEGPVRYLLSRREEKEFRALKDDASRSEFIHLFWKRRDPVPETPENEARLAFWKRVVEANATFHDSALPGWKTDRGKIHILIGPPTDIEELPDYRVDDRTSAQTGVIRWIYQGVLSGPAFSGTYVVPFVRANDGSYRLSTSSRLASPAFNPLAQQDRTSPDIARIQSNLDYGVADLGVALDQALLQTPPWQEKDFIDRVTSEAFLGALPMRVSFDYLRAADGSTFALITCAVPLSAFTDRAGMSSQPEITSVARLSPEGGGDSIDLGESSFSPAPTNEDLVAGGGAKRTEKPPETLTGSAAEIAPGEKLLLYQARTPLRPGRYDLWVGLFERQRLQAANLRTTIEVPDLGGPLAVSSIILGRSIRPVPEGTGGYNRPFRISDFEIIPSVGVSYRPGDTLTAFWQIYSEAPTGRGSKLSVTMRFYRAADGAEIPVGKPRVVEDAEPVQAFSFELKGWPASTYRFEVSVRDREGRTAVRSMGFSVQ